MSFTSEFKEFAMKGNVVDLAVGVIIGAAFGAIVNSLVGDIIMPVIGAFGSLDFNNYFLALSKNVTATNLADAKKQGAVLAYGLNMLLMQQYEQPRLPMLYPAIGAFALWLLGQLAVLGPALRAASVPLVVATRTT